MSDETVNDLGLLLKLSGEPGAVEVVLRTIPIMADEWVASLEGPEALDGALEAIREARRELAVVEGLAEGRLALSWPDDGKEAVINGWVCVRDYAPPSWRWDRDALATELRAMADDDPEVTYGDLLEEVAGGWYARVGALRRLGLEPDLYREPSGEHRWKVRRKQKAERHIDPETGEVLEP